MESKEDLMKGLIYAMLARAYPAELLKRLGVVERLHEELDTEVEESPHEVEAEMKREREMLRSSGN